MDKITTANGIIEQAKALGKEYGHFRAAVAAAEDDDVLRACSEAAKFTLYGSEKKLKDIGATNGIDFSGFTIVDCESAAKSAYLAAQAANKGEADLIQKGFLSTSALLKTILSKDFALRTQNTVSHVAVLNFPGYHKLLGITDGGMVVKPTFEQKIQLIDNAVTLFQTLGYEKPRVAVSAPIDYIHPKIPATTEAAQLTGMSKNGEIENCEIYGPASRTMSLVMPIFFWSTPSRNATSSPKC
jgi:phosphate butyryltransferase